MLKIGLAGVLGVLIGGLIAWYLELPAASSATVLVVIVCVAVVQAIAAAVPRGKKR